MAKKPSRQTGKKTGRLVKEISIPAMKLSQGAQDLFVFKLKASELWGMVSINRRNPDKDEGYQRVLPNSRVKSLSGYIQEGHPIPNSVVLSFDKAKFDEKSGELQIPSGKDVGWVIDGQHRLAGAHEAFKESGTDYELPVVAFTGLSEEAQVEQFITINREAKGVPSSLVLDLLNMIPKKKPSDLANERAADIAKELRDDKDSPLYNRIVIDAPSKGQISLTNFVRKVTPLVHQENGVLKSFTFEEQSKILKNYFSAIKSVFHDEWSQTNSIFLRTIGFGALMNVFQRVFDETSRRYSSFQQQDVVRTLKLVESFDFGQWSSHGSGTKAENDAAKDLLIDFDRAIQSKEEDGKFKKMKL